MKAAGDVYIAGSKTMDDWKAFRNTLALGGDSEWKSAFEEYFHQRLSLRYLEPIRVLQDHGTFQGEGFSIVAIQCTLIEFLASTVEGKNYRFRRKGDPPLGPYEYSNSCDLFVTFLAARQPFQNVFDSVLARDFYAGVRCGLLHEARTKNGWTIWAKSPSGTIIDGGQKIVYRNDLQAGILAFVKWYESALKVEVSLQEAFVRKFDSLCN